MLTTLLLMTGLASALTPLAPPKPSASQTALYDALKLRHEGPPCSDLAELSEAVADDLVWLVENVKHPPWVGIRAAQCVIREHTEAKADAIDLWVSEANHRGLALLTMGLLDELPEPAAVRFATLALEGPLADEARERLIDSVHLSVGNLAQQSMAEQPESMDETKPAPVEPAPVTDD